MENTMSESVHFTFRNEVGEADVWLLSNTEENRETSLWGTATIAKATPGTAYTLELTKADHDEYLLRVIDNEGMYYESDAITLREDYTLTVRRIERKTQLVITDADGKTVFEGFLFEATL